MFIVYTSNCHGQNCTRRAIYRLGIDTLIANILVKYVFFSLLILITLLHIPYKSSGHFISGFPRVLKSLEKS